MIKPFKFKLKKVSRKKQELLDALQEYLPATGVREGFLEGIKEAISKHIGKEISFQLEAVHQESFSSYTAKLSESPILAVFGMDPLNGKALCDIDSLLAVMLVERLLGGQPGASLKMRDLSDTEQGVLQYLILQVLASVYRICGQNSRVHFRFDRFVTEGRLLREIADSDDGVAILVFRVKVGRHAGFVRMVFPDPFIEESFLNGEAAGEVRSEERVYRLKMLSRFGYVRVPLWAEAGRTTLLPSELAGIEEGDIVILDDGDVRPSEKGLYGSAVLRVGDGHQGGLEAELNTDKKYLHCRVTGFRKGE